LDASHAGFRDQVVDGSVAGSAAPLSPGSLLGGVKPVITRLPPKSNILDRWRDILRFRYGSHWLASLQAEANDP